MLDIQLKRELFDDVWSVSISHAAEVLQNWNLIGFQVDIYYFLFFNYVRQRLSVGPLYVQ